MKVSISPKCIQTYLSQNLSKLKPTTSLIISSAPPPPSPSSPSKKDIPLSTYQNQISHHIQSIQFYTSMKYNLKTVQYGNRTLTSSFPTLDHRSQVLEMMERSGVGKGSDDGVVFGVGSGVAIDLAKACYHYNNFEHEQGIGLKYGNNELVLIPSTLSSVLACTSNNCLMLDLHEEALVTSSSSTSSFSSNAIDKTIDNGVTILIDDKLLAVPNWFNVNSKSNLRRKIPTVIDASLASIVLAIDFLLFHAGRGISNNTIPHDEVQYSHQMNNVNHTMKHALSCLTSITKTFELDEMTNNEVTIDPSIKNHAINAMLHAGKLLSFGNEMQTRNISLALSSAILPKYFPHGNLLTFIASLLPGILDGYKAKGGYNSLGKDVIDTLEFVEGLLCIDNEYSKIIPTLSSLAEGAPDVNELIQKVEGNGALLGCNDWDSDLIECVLFASLNR
jgi:hypothetical protein